MASDGVDLGRLGLASTASDLQLELTSSAKIASPEEGAELARYGLMNTAKPWSRRGNDFSLSVSLAFDGDFANLSARAVIDTITQRLGAAKQWQQLPLRPVSIRSTIAHCGESSIVVQLDHDEKVDPGRRLHKLEDGVLDHDRSPPWGVQLVTLNEVHLSMRFTGTLRRKRRKLEPSLSECLVPSPHGVQVLKATSDVDLPSQEDLQQDDTETTISKTPESHEKKGTSFRRSKTSPAREVTPNVDDEMLFEAKSPPSGPSGHLVCIGDASLKRSYSTGDLRNKIVPLTNDDNLLELFDAGLRLAISSNTRRLPRAIHIVSNESFKHLTDTFPSLWSPGYLAAVSSRAVFLPTISHALVNVCSLHARSTTLRSKILELHRQDSNLPSSFSTATDAVREGRSSHEQDSMAARLWRAMQSSLADKSTAPRLETFSRSFEDNMEEDADLWVDSVLANYCIPDQDIDDFASDSDESMLDYEEPLTPEPENVDPVDSLWNDLDTTKDEMPKHEVFRHVADGERGLHVDGLQEDDEVLSLCESVGSIALHDGMDLAFQGPGGSSMTSEEMVQKNLCATFSDQEVEVDEMIPI